MTANFELNLEERLALLHRDRRRTDGRRQVRFALALLLGQPGLLGAISLRARLLSFTLAPFCVPLLGALEHVGLRSNVIIAERTDGLAVIPDISESEPELPGIGARMRREAHSDREHNIGQLRHAAGRRASCRFAVEKRGGTMG